ARKRDTQAKKAQTAEEKKRAEDKRKAEEEAAQKAQEEIKAAEEAAAASVAEAPAADAGATAEPAEAAPADSDSAPTSKHPPARKFTPVEAPKRAEPKVKPKVGRSDRNDRRQSGKLTVNRALRGEDGAARARSLAALKRAREKEKRAQMSGQPRE